MANAPPPNIPVDSDVAVTNLTSLFDALMGADGAGGGLLDAIAMIAGVYFVMRGIMMYRAFGQSQQAASGKAEIAGPLVHIVIGIVLWNIQQVKDVGLNTLGLPGNLQLSYIQDSGMEQWAKIQGVLGKYIKLIGYIAFLRGWFILSKMGHPGAQPGSVGKGITHIIGGLFLINFMDTAVLLAGLMGIK